MSAHLNKRSCSMTVICAATIISTLLPLPSLAAETPTTAFPLAVAAAPMKTISTPIATPTLPPDSAPINLAPGLKAFPYRNPVYPGSAPDPAMLRVGDYIYTAVTGERIMRSRDLVNWETIGSLFSAGKPAWADPNSVEIWAPDLNYINGKYVAYFTARAAGFTDIHRGIGVAWSDKPEGPYQAAPKPFAVGPGIRNIDPMAFLDDDGRRYLYWGSGKEPILVQELSADGFTLLGEPKIALKPDPFIRYSKLVEGTWVIKRAGYYYIFWSGDGYPPGLYAVSVARSTSPWGPFERYSGNPIVMENIWWTSPGHNSLMQDDAGQDWLVYHAYDTSDTDYGRMLMIDKLIWKNGWPSVAQRVPSSKLVEDGPVWNTTAIPLVEIAAGKPCTASSEQERKNAAKAVDGSTYSGWAPLDDDKEGWLRVDLGAVQHVARVDLRFRKADSGDYRYLIESSLDGVNWQIFADHTQIGSTYPYVEKNEATARYIRVRRVAAPTSGDATLYELRIFAYKSVWIANPDTLVPASGLIPIQVHVDPQMKIKSATVTLDGQQIYAGAEVPSEPIKKVELQDGNHEIVLSVVDTNQTIWQHELHFKVANSQIVAPTEGNKLQGSVPIQLKTGYLTDALRKVEVKLTPLVNGDLNINAAQILYSEKSMPTALSLDTGKLADGAYQLDFSTQSIAGTVSTSSTRIMVKNWDLLSDEFEPPVSQGWFGLVERKKTVFESSDWGYDTTSPELFFGDIERRVWQGQGTGDLIWEMPRLHGFTFTIYTRNVSVGGLSLSVSPDQTTWQSVPFTVKQVEPTSAGWYKLTVTGEVAKQSNYLRISLPAQLSGNQFQLGRVEITALAQ